MDDLIPQDLIESLDLGRAPTRRGTPVSFEVVRHLTEEDIPLLLAPPPAELPKQRLHRVTLAHHKLAQLVVSGMDDAAASLVSGYSPSYVSMLRGDPTFRELIAYYSANAEAIFIDTAERMKTLGLSAVEELQRRVDEEPEKWTKKELLEVADSMLVKPAVAQVAARGADAGAPQINVGISFVKPQPTVEAQVIDAVDLEAKP